MPSTRRKKNNDSEPSFWHRHRLIMIKSAFGIFACSFLVLTSYLLYRSYHDFRDPEKIYGEWIEIGAPPYQTERLTFSPDGVYRNHRLVTTTFDFDGKVITLHTGLGKTAYKTAGSHLSPQLHRIEPLIPDQRFVRKGFEHTVKGSESGAASRRRSALSEHFTQDWNPSFPLLPSHHLIHK